MEEAINNIHVIENVDNKLSDSEMDSANLKSDQIEPSNEIQESAADLVDRNHIEPVSNDNIPKIIVGENTKDVDRNIEGMEVKSSEDIANNKTVHDLNNISNSEDAERVIPKTSLEQLCAEIVGDSDLGEGDIEYQGNLLPNLNEASLPFVNDQSKTSDGECSNIELPVSKRLPEDHKVLQESNISHQLTNENSKTALDCKEIDVLKTDQIIENNPQSEDVTNHSDLLTEMDTIINSPIVLVPNIPLPIETISPVEKISEITNHEMQYLESNSDYNNGNTAITTDDEISLIHGEPPAADNSIIDSISEKNLKYISRVSTQEIIDVYDKKDTLRKMHMSSPSFINNSIDFIRGSLNSDLNGGSINLGQDTAVMNNSQLLAILEEGNDQVNQPTSTKNVVKIVKSGNIVLKRRPRAIALDPAIEGQMALKQLKELPILKRKSPQKISQIVDVKIPKTTKNCIIIKKVNPVTVPPVPQTSENCDPLKTTPAVKTYSKKSSKSDISDLMADWDDEKPEEQIADSLCSTNDSAMSDNSINTSKTLVVKKPDVLHTQRVSRIIKKKIIFDPDNPDTFKYAAAIIKKDKTQVRNITESPKLSTHKLESIKPATESEIKKLTGNTEPVLILNKMLPADKSGTLNSAVVVMHKPKVGRPKLGKTPNKIILPNSQLEKPRKQTSPILTPSKKKKMTEVDRLLMDEGALNMLYQVEMSNNNSETAEIEEIRPNKKSMISISKEKKNMISKAKIIKRAVFSLTKSDDPSKVLKVFRSRKEGTPKTNRLRSGMQSPTMSEISVSGSVADESRIIRRHSSSSFSSGCLSPRPSSPENVSRLNSTQSDESFQLANDSGIQSSTPLKSNSSFENIVPVPMSVSKIKRRGRPPNSLSVKQKKTVDESEPTYQKKTVLPMSGLSVFDSFTQLSLQIGDDRVARIIVQPTGNTEELYDIQVLKELATAIRVSNQAGALLLTSETGNLCSGLDLRCVIQPTVELQRENAENILSAFRELAVAICECECGIVSGVDGACSGIGVPLLTLSDLALASDRATFCAAPRSRRPMPPEGAALLARPQSLPPQLSRELVLCGRKLTASEALQRGLVSRTLWPDRFLEEIKSIAADLTTHPPECFKIMKGVLRRGESDSVAAALRHEGKMLTDFWCSAEGQEAIQKSHAHL